MKRAKLKGFLLGILMTLFVEVAIFMYYTCNIQVETKYIYNPEIINEFLGNPEVVIK